MAARDASLERVGSHRAASGQQWDYGPSTRGLGSSGPSDPVRAPPRTLAIRRPADLEVKTLGHHAGRPYLAATGSDLGLP